jgi:hypothetical protein
MFSPQLKIVKCDDGLALILPPDLLAHLKAAVGDILHVALIPHGIELSTIVPNPHRQHEQMNNDEDKIGD